MLNPKSAGLAAAGALIGVLAAVTAGAQVPVQDDSAAPKLTVKYPLSQLETDEGVRRLYARLQRAAERVCPQPTGLLIDPAIRACRQQAVEDAVAQIHNTRLAALSGKPRKAG